jgi:protein disulfide-isomerase
MRFLTASLLLATFLAAPLAAKAGGPPPIYDEGVDAKAAIQATLADAAKAKLPVLVVFGANWCGDCRMLDATFKHGPSAPLINQHFKVVKVDVGRFDRNVDIAEGYRVPLKKGIPAVAVLSPQGKLLYATEGGELADARKMGDQGVYDFFTRIAATAQ